MMIVGYTGSVLCACVGHRDDNIDIEAVFKQNKDPLPAGPRMVGLKRGSEDDEEKRKCK